MTIGISEFEANCFDILDRVAGSGETLVITRWGRPLVMILPASGDSGGDWLGSLRGTARATDDLIGPAVDSEDWRTAGE